MIWPTISAAERLRTRRWVPVWQKRQVSVQPTWEETQSVPRSSSGMWTVSTSWPSANPSSHLRVPSIDCRSTTAPGPRDDIALGQIGAEALGQRGHRGEIGGAAMIDPVPELAGAEGRLADPGELGLELRPVEPDQLDSAIGGRGRRGEDIRMAGRAHDLPTGPCRRRRSPDRPWRSRAGNRYR